MPTRESSWFKTGSLEKGEPDRASGVAKRKRYWREQEGSVKT